MRFFSPRPYLGEGPVVPNDGVRAVILSPLTELAIHSTNVLITSNNSQGHVPGIIPIPYPLQLFLINSNIFYSKIMFRLSDEQWALIQPHLSPSSPGRGRPTIDQRSVLEGILWKLSTHSPWYAMPSAYPSYQTCYRRYLQWKRTGEFTQVFRLLYRDLRDRGGLDTFKALADGTIRLSRQGSKWVFSLPPNLEGTWQASVARLFIYHLIKTAQSIAEKPTDSLIPLEGI